MTMLPRLSAEESIAQATRVAVGTGSLKDDDRRRVTRAWERAAEGDRRPPAQKATAQQLAAIGIAVKQVAAAKGADG